MKVLNLIRGIIESHYIIIGLAFFVGLLYPDNILWASPYTTFILAVIFFLSALKIDLKKVLRQLNDKTTLLIINIFLLFLLPAIVYYTFGLFYPSLVVAFLILAAMPIGMTTPLLTEIAGGRQSLALVLTVTTSLLAPLTAPFVIKFLAGTSIEVDVLGMFTLLAMVIYLPFIIAQFFKYLKIMDQVCFTDFNMCLHACILHFLVAECHWIHAKIRR